MLSKNYVKKNWCDKASLKVFLNAFIYFLEGFIDKYLEKTEFN